MKMKIVLYLVIMVIRESETFSSTDSNTTSACTPKYGGKHVVIECCHENATEIYNYFDYLQKNKTLQSFKIIIRSNTIDTLRANLFGQLRVRHVIIQCKNLSKLDVQTFGGQEHNINVLAFAQTKLSNIPIEIFNQMTNLHKLLFILSKKVKLIPHHAFLNVNSSNIFLLSFSADNIGYIGEGAFSNLFRLRYISLKFNRIKEINANIFPKHPIRLNVAAKSNHLTEMPSELISKMKSSSRLDLENNMITSVNVETIAEIITKKIRVDLSSNPINCGCSFAKLAMYNAITNTTKYITETTKCKSPARLSTVPLNLLQASFFDKCTDSTPMMSSTSSVIVRNTAIVVKVDVVLLQSTLLLLLADLM
ncbi:Uncharacterised protein at_DN0096 [Pycnogonum litorale]